MNSTRDGFASRQALRAKAEALVVNLNPNAESTKPQEVLMHELLVHKIELEMQNEDLRLANLALEEVRDRYVDLYEFSPVSYISLSREGLMSEINLTGSALLGVERTKLIQHRFSTFVASEDQDRWHRLFFNMMEQASSERHALALVLRSANGSKHFVHLDCLRRVALDGARTLRITLTDISHIKLTEQ